GAALRQLGIARLHETLIFLAVLEEINLNNGVRRRKLQLLEDLIGQIAQLTEQGLIDLYLEIRQKDKLRNPIGMLARRGQERRFRRLVGRFGGGGPEAEGAAACR